MRLALARGRRTRDDNGDNAAGAPLTLPSKVGPSRFMLTEPMTSRRRPQDAARPADDYFARMHSARPFSCALAGANARATSISSWPGPTSGANNKMAQALTLFALSAASRRPSALSAQSSSRFLSQCVKCTARDARRCRANCQTRAEHTHVALARQCVFGGVCAWAGRLGPPCPPRPAQTVARPCRDDHHDAHDNT